MQRIPLTDLFTINQKEVDDYALNKVFLADPSFLPKKQNSF
jgi:hypothetical protein